eukprot:PhM_4_TR17391/c5_g2_i1/m.85729
MTFLTARCRWTQCQPSPLFWITHNRNNKKKKKTRMILSGNSLARSLSSRPPMTQYRPPSPLQSSSSHSADNSNNNNILRLSLYATAGCAQRQQEQEQEEYDDDDDEYPLARVALLERLPQSQALCDDGGAEEVDDDPLSSEDSDLPEEYRHAMSIHRQRKREEREKRREQRRRILGRGATQQEEDDDKAQDEVVKDFKAMPFGAGVKLRRRDIRMLSDPTDFLMKTVLDFHIRCVLLRNPNRKVHVFGTDFLTPLAHHDRPTDALATGLFLSAHRCELDRCFLCSDVLIFPAHHEDHWYLYIVHKPLLSLARHTPPHVLSKILPAMELHDAQREANYKELKKLKKLLNMPLIRMSKADKQEERRLQRTVSKDDDPRQSRHDRVRYYFGLTGLHAAQTGLVNTQSLSLYDGGAHELADPDGYLTQAAWSQLSQGVPASRWIEKPPVLEAKHFPERVWRRGDMFLTAARLKEAMTDSRDDESLILFSSSRRVSELPHEVHRTAIIDFLVSRYNMELGFASLKAVARLPEHSIGFDKSSLPPNPSVLSSEQLAAMSRSIRKTCDLGEMPFPHQTNDCDNILHVCRAIETLHMPRMVKSFIAHSEPWVLPGRRLRSLYSSECACAKRQYLKELVLAMNKEMKEKGEKALVRFVRTYPADPHLQSIDDAVALISERSKRVRTDQGT